MALLNDGMQAVVLMVCDRHAPLLLEKLRECTEGNWFAMPPVTDCRAGYHPHVSPAHSATGCAIFGFAERQTLAQRLREFASLNPDGSLCPNCMAYQWSVTPTPLGDTGRDPVCERMVSGTSSISHYHDGELFLFCRIHCRDAFIKSPHDYLPRQQVLEEAAAPRLPAEATV